VTRLLQDDGFLQHPTDYREKVEKNYNYNSARSIRFVIVSSVPLIIKNVWMAPGS
jgi:hypothetical protein